MGNAMSGELEESKALLEAAIRGQRQVEQELIDTREQVTDVSASNNSLGNAKWMLDVWLMSSALSRITPPPKRRQPGQQRFPSLKCRTRLNKLPLPWLVEPLRFQPS